MAVRARPRPLMWPPPSPLPCKQKRRIYDITNVLEGIGLIAKCGKNNVRFAEGLSASVATPADEQPGDDGQAQQGQEERAQQVAGTDALLADLEAMRSAEAALDTQLAAVWQGMKGMTEHALNVQRLYVTDHDVMGLPPIQQTDQVRAGSEGLRWEQETSGAGCSKRAALPCPAASRPPHPSSSPTPAGGRCAGAKGYNPAGAGARGWSGGGRRAALQVGRAGSSAGHGRSLRGSKAGRQAGNGCLSKLPLLYAALNPRALCPCSLPRSQDHHPQRARAD